MHDALLCTWRCTLARTRQQTATWIHTNTPLHTATKLKAPKINSKSPIIDNPDNDGLQVLTITACMPTRQAQTLPLKHCCSCTVVVPIGAASHSRENEDSTRVCSLQHKTTMHMRVLYTSCILERKIHRSIQVIQVWDLRLYAMNTPTKLEILHDKVPRAGFRTFQYRKLQYKLNSTLGYHTGKQLLLSTVQQPPQPTLPNHTRRPTRENRTCLAVSRCNSTGTLLSIIQAEDLAAAYQHEHSLTPRDPLIPTHAATAVTDNCVQHAQNCGAAKARH